MNSASKPALLPPNFAPCVIVHSRAQAELALSLTCPVTLLSARGAVLAGGVGWWQALVAQARAVWPNTECNDILDCADAPGLAMSALRLGQTYLRLDADCPAFGAVAKAASHQQSVLVAVVPEALDLSHRGAERHLSRHLYAQTQQMVTMPDRDRPDTLR